GTPFRPGTSGDDAEHAVRHVCGSHSIDTPASRQAGCVWQTDGHPLMDRHLVLEQIYAALDAVNSQLPPSRRLSRTPETVIVGPGGALDSLGLVNFVLAVEEKMGDAIG